ncbi:MAG: VCBS repeat-containing protein, partial [Myxococcota bacterium]
MPRSSVLPSALSLCIGWVFFSCSGSDQPLLDDDVAQTLANLNIDTQPSPRLDANGSNLPESYAPLGLQRTLNKKSELFLAGLDLKEHGGGVVTVAKYIPGVSGIAGVQDVPEDIAVLPQTDLDTTWKTTAYNASAAGDFDGDGLDEVAIIYWESTTNAIRLKFFDDSLASFEESNESTLTTATPTYLKLIAGDFTGDGKDDLAVGIADDNAKTVTVNIVTGTFLGSYAISGSAPTYAASLDGTLGIEMAAGRLDRDAPDELAVVINETVGGGSNGTPGGGIATYYIYDDLGTEFKQEATGAVSAFVEGATQDGVTGTVALGDIDGDGLDEIVLAALADDFSRQCDSIKTVQFVLDDLAAGLLNLGASLNDDQRPNGCEVSGNNGATTHLWAGTLDIDGDQVAEIHINGVVFDDFKNAPAWQVLTVDSGSTSKEAIIDFEAIFKEQQNNGRLKNDRNNTIMTTGDFTADGV